MDISAVPHAILDIIKAVDDFATSIKDAEESVRSLKANLDSIRNLLESLENNVEDNRDGSIRRLIGDNSHLKRSLGEIEAWLGVLESQSESKSKLKQRCTPWKPEPLSQGSRKNIRQPQPQSELPSESKMTYVSKIRSLSSEGQKKIKKFLDEWESYKTTTILSLTIFRYEHQLV